jgi:hypothetical protein
MTDHEYGQYLERTFFFNATARTVEGYLGYIFRREPAIRAPQTAALGHAFHEFLNDVDLQGHAIGGYARRVVLDTVALGRAGTLIDWDDSLGRPYLAFYPAEHILNWHRSRLDGRWQLDLLVLRETAFLPGGDPFQPQPIQQLRVLRLVPASSASTHHCVVELWQLLSPPAESDPPDQSDPAHPPAHQWTHLSTVTPLRLGQPIPSIPFVFHGPRDASPDVARSPISDIIAANLDHYRLTAGYRHGMHFTALPTAFLSGFKSKEPLRVGSAVAWVTDEPRAKATYLEYKGDGLETFERALDRCERLLSVLGSRLLESNKRVSESAEAISLRQSGENSVIAHLALACSASLTHVLRWVYWWNSTIDTPHRATAQEVLVELNTDFDTAQMTAEEIQALVRSWQAGAISRDTLLYRLRQGEILPPGRTPEEELALVQKQPPESVAGSGSSRRQEAPIRI